MDALLIFLGSFGLLPFIGKEFSPQVDESFISLRLNTPVGTSLEFTDKKVREAEAALKQFPEILLAMTTMGNAWDGRNYARINLKLTDRDKRARTQKDLERDIRNALDPSRASSSRWASTGRSGSTCWGPIRRR